MIRLTNQIDTTKNSLDSSRSSKHIAAHITYREQWRGWPYEAAATGVDSVSFKETSLLVRCQTQRSELTMRVTTEADK